jgi:cytochrome c
VVAPIAVRLQTADVAAGKEIANKCLACHTLDKGQPAKIGPNLYGVVGGPAAHMEGFKYSKAMEDRHAAGGTWMFADLDTFLTSPKAFVPGTAMGFAGLPKPQDRANVIAYLNTLSDKPQPLAAPEAAAAPAPASDAAAPATPAPATGAAPATEAAPAAPAPATEAAPATPAPATPTP